MAERDPMAKALRARADATMLEAAVIRAFGTGPAELAATTGTGRRRARVRLRVAAWAGRRLFGLPGRVIAERLGLRDAQAAFDAAGAIDAQLLAGRWAVRREVAALEAALGLAPVRGTYAAEARP